MKWPTSLSGGLVTLLAIAVTAAGQSNPDKAGQATQSTPAPKSGAKSPKNSSGPVRIPNLYLKSATDDGVVTGHTTDSGKMVRITVSKEGGEVRTEPVWPDASGDFTIPLLLLKSGWIVQAWAVDKGNDVAHSAAMAVKALSPPDPSLTRMPKRKTMAGSLSDDPEPAAPPAPAPEPPPAPALAPEPPQSPGRVRAAADEERRSAAVPVHVCDPDGLDSDGTLHLENGSSELSGSSLKVPHAWKGKVVVCINGHQRLIHDTSDLTSPGGAFKNSKFDVTLADSITLTTGDYVLVSMISPTGRRVALEGNVPAPATLTASACDSITKGSQIIQLDRDVVNANASEIRGALPDSTGAVTVCLNNTAVDLAAGPGPASASTTFASTFTPTGNRLDILLKTAPAEGQLLRIAWISADKTLRSVKDVTVQGPKFSRVIIPALPKEGDTVVHANTDLPPADNDKSATPLSLSVFVNQDRATLVDASTSSDAVSQRVALTGDTALTLKNPIGAGDCVVVVEFSGTSLPSEFDFNRMACDAKHVVPHTIPPEQTYAYSYPLLSNSTFNWGRVRGYLAAGGLFSYDNSQFSQESIFLGFNLTKNWVWGGPLRHFEDGHMVDGYRHSMFETYFDARLTSLPVAACANKTDTTTTCPNTVDTFLAATKMASLNAGASMPFVTATWTYAHTPYALTMGPIAKVGFNTPLTDIAANSQAVVPQSFYTNFGFGGRLGLYRMSYSTSVSPDLQSYIDVVAGRFSNFDIPTPEGTIARPWRIGIEGILNVPRTPFILGFGANVHQNFGSKHVPGAKDSLQFLFGAKFDAGKLFAKVGSIM